MSYAKAKARAKHRPFHANTRAASSSSSSSASCASSSSSRKGKRKEIDPNRNCAEFDQLHAAYNACVEWELSVESKYEEEDQITIYGFLSHFENEFNGHGDQNDSWHSNLAADPTGKCLKEAKIGFKFSKQFIILQEKYPHLLQTLTSLITETPKRSKNAAQPSSSSPQ